MRMRFFFFNAVDSNCCGGSGPSCLPCACVVTHGNMRLFFLTLMIRSAATGEWGQGVCRAPAKSTHGNICPLPCVIYCSARQRDINFYFLYSYKLKFQILGMRYFVNAVFKIR
jgi:hypothetical protein